MNTIYISKSARSKTLRIFLALGWLLCASALSTLADDLAVSRGSTVRIVISEGIRKIFVVNPSVIDARPDADGETILISGLTDGTSELRIDKMSGGQLVTNVVVRSDLNDLLSQVKDLLGDVEGLSMKVVGDKIVLEGNILTKDDYDKVGRVVAAYAGSILNLTTFTRDDKMNWYVAQAILKDIGMPGVTARVMGDTVILEGVVNSAVDLKRAEEVARLKIPNVKNLLQVQEVMIETDVQFVEVKTDNSKNFGQNIFGVLGFTGSTAGGAGNRSLPASFGVTASPTIAAFVGGTANGVNYGIGSANSRIVAEPHISTKSGETGTFQQGGTKYFSVAGNIGGSLQSVDYGVILKVKPTMVDTNEIQNDVDIEVSMPVADPSSTLSLDKYSTTCSALCKIGESMVLSGETQKQTTRSTTGKTPVLGDVPLLDLFFSNKQSDRSRIEYVIVLTPRLVYTTAAMGEPMGDQHKEILEPKDSKD